MPHKFYADFVLFDNIISEVKAAEGGISDEFVSRTLNHLKVSKCKIGLIANLQEVDSSTGDLYHKEV